MIYVRGRGKDRAPLGWYIPQMLAELSLLPPREVGIRIWSWDWNLVLWYGMWWGGGGGGGLNLLNQESVLLRKVSWTA